MNLKGDSRNKCKGLKLVTGGQMNEGEFIISTTTGREQRVFPSEMNLGLISGNKTANPWPKLSRNITSSESGRMSNPYSRSILPKIEIKNSYTETPYTYTKMNNLKTTNKAHKILKYSIEERGCTANTKYREKIKNQQILQRISTAQVISEKRPESRYNKKSLYAKLDHGRAASPDYNVPVIDMNFSELANQEVIPECWK